MALKQALQTLNSAVQDLTSLHVQTYSGTIAFQDRGDNEAFDNLRKKLAEGKGPDDTAVDVHLKLETLVKFDGDSYNFVAKEDVSDSLFKLHKDALKSGLETRLGLMEMLKDVFDIDVGQ
jgi:hypothetical protein